jgi:hypothetical protein
VDVIVGANVIVAALGNGNDIVGVVDLSWTREIARMSRRPRNALRASIGRERSSFS